MPLWEGYPQVPQKEVKKMKKGKKYVEVSKLVDKNKLYTKEEAVELVKKTSTTKFDASVELAIRLNVDTKKADQQLRGAIVLPNGTGKTKRVLVIAKGEQANAAKEAGADYVGDVDILNKIEKENWLEFDVMIATPDMMPALGKIGKILGPKGLMPNPKSGTVTFDVGKAIKEIKAGKVEYRLDKTNIIHVPVGKKSFGAEKLIDNLKVILEAVIKAKPAAAKGKYLKSVTIASTMGPGIKLNTTKLMD